MPLSIVAHDTFTGTGTRLNVTLNAARAAGDYLMMLATLRVTVYSSPNFGLIHIYESTYPTKYWESFSDMTEGAGDSGGPDRMAMPWAWMFYDGSQPASYQLVSAFTYSSGVFNEVVCDWLVSIVTIRGLTGEDQFYNEFGVFGTTFSSDVYPKPSQWILTGQQRGSGAFTSPGPAALAGFPVTWTQLATASAAHGSHTAFLTSPPHDTGSASWNNFAIAHANIDFIKRAIELPSAGVVTAGWRTWIID